MYADCKELAKGFKPMRNGDIFLMAFDSVSKKWMSSRTVLVIVQNSSKFIDPILFRINALVTFFIEDEKIIQYY